MKSRPRFRLPLPWPRVGLLACVLAGAVCTRAVLASEDTPPLVVGKRLFEGGHYAEARAAFERVVAAEPQNAEALFDLGWTAFRQNQPAESAKLLEKATALDGTKSLYFRVLGACVAMIQRASFFAKAGWARKSLAAYDRAVALDPDDLDARAGRLNYYWHAPGIAGGSMDKARAEAEVIRKRDPVRGAQALADLNVAEKEYAEAFAVIDDLIAKHPDNKPAQYQLGRLAAITGQQLDRGVTALQDYLHYSPQARTRGRPLAPGHDPREEGRPDRRPRRIRSGTQPRPGLRPRPGRPAETAMTRVGHQRYPSARRFAP
jgi:tetratricopeptide (TPR) repeat protein